MRHLFVTVDYPPDLGGMARRHVELCRRLASEGVTVSTVAATPVGPGERVGPIAERADPAAKRSAYAGAQHFDRQEPYRITRQPFTFRGARTTLNRWRWGRSLAQAVRETDVIHCGNIRPCGYPVLAARRRVPRPTPFLLYVNGSDLLREREKISASVLKRWFLRRLFSRAAGIVANSAWTAETAWALCETLGIDAGERVTAIDLGTDPAQFRPQNNRGSLRERLGWQDRCVLLTVARLVPHKGQDVALRAVAAVVREHPSVHYLIVGHGPQEPVLRRLASELGIADRVAFVGALSDEHLAEAYATADIYVGLSRQEGLDVEGFGISFIEAAASGLPVIAGDSGGVRSAVRDGETGVVVKPNDADAVATTLRQLLASPERRRALGAAGRRAVETHYNWDRVARETAALARRALRETERD